MYVNPRWTVTPAGTPWGVAQSVRVAGIYPACRGFESFRSDLPGFGILHPDIPGMQGISPKRMGHEPLTRVMVRCLNS